MSSRTCPDWPELMEIAPELQFKHYTVAEARLPADVLMHVPQVLLSEVAICCSSASERSCVSTATFVSASASCGLRELRGAERRVREADPNAGFLRRLTMVTWLVDEQKIMHRQQPSEAEAVKY